MKKLLVFATVLTMLTTFSSCHEPEKRALTLRVTSQDAASFSMIKIVDGQEVVESELSTPHELSIEASSCYFLFKSKNVNQEVNVEATSPNGTSTSGRSSLVVFYSDPEKVTAFAL